MILDELQEAQDNRPSPMLLMTQPYLSSVNVDVLMEKIRQWEMFADKIQEKFAAYRAEQEKKDKQLSEDIQENLKRRAWNHYAIDDTIQGHHVRIPRCDKYSDYALVLSCVFMRDVEEVLKELLEK